MDLRNEILKEKENSKNSGVNLEKIFIDYIKGEEISKENEEKILDELQNCVNAGNYDKSIFRDVLSYCNCPRPPRSFYRSIPGKFEHASFIYEQLKGIRDFPTAVNIVLNEINIQKKKNRYNEILDDYNKLLKKNNIKKLDENYTIEDLETSIIEFIEKKQRKLFENETEADSSFDSRNIDIDIDILFYLKDNSHYLLDEKGSFKNSSWMKALYASYLLKNSQKKFLFSMEIREMFYLSNLQIYGFGIKKMGTDYYIIYDKSNEKIIDSLLNDYKKERDNLKNISQKRLEKFILKLKNKINNKNDINQENLKTIMKNLNENSIKVFVFEHEFVHATNILIIDDCFYAIIQDGNFDRIEYGYFTPQDYFTWESESTEKNVDLSPLMKISNSQKNSASVVGRTIAGHLIGGTFGGIVGAMSAIEKNKRVEYVQNQLKNEPLIHKYHIETAKINLYLMCLLGDKFHYEQLCIRNVEILDELLANLIVASSDEITIILKYIKKYFELNGDITYDEKKINKFINNEIKDNQKRIIEEYWKEHPDEKKKLDNELEKLKEQEKILNKKLKKLDETNSLKIKEIKEKYSNKITEEKELKKVNNKINKLEEELESCGLFKFSKKKEIKESIISLEEQLDTLTEKVNTKKKELNRKKNTEIKKLTNEQTVVEEEIKNNQLEQQKIISKLQLVKKR